MIWKSDFDTYFELRKKSVEVNHINEIINIFFKISLSTTLAVAYFEKLTIVMALARKPMVEITGTM